MGGCCVDTEDGIQAEAGHPTPPNPAGHKYPGDVHSQVHQPAMPTQLRTSGTSQPSHQPLTNEQSKE